MILEKIHFLPSDTLLNRNHDAHLTVRCVTEGAKLAKKGTKRNDSPSYDDVLRCLLDDPTRSVGSIAADLGSNRQTVWRKKRRMEEDNIIWGYTAVADESKLNHIMYLMLMKTKPLSKVIADTIITRVKENEMEKQDIRLIDLWYVNGEYDWALRFSGPAPATARRYYDTVRVIYDEYLLEKPVLLELNFCLVAEGKRNPELNTFYDFVAH